MKIGHALLVVAVIAVVLSVAGTVFTYLSIQSYKSNWVTGFASSSTATGTANLSVEATAQINFTVYEINWSSGRVNTGVPNATLDTSAGTVTNGNWSAVSRGFLVQNQGNTNVSLNLKTSKTAATLLGGTSPIYQWNVSVTGGNTTACLNATNGTTNDLGAHTYNKSVFTGVTTSDFLVCDKFQYIQNNNTVRIDVRLQVPSDSLTGALSDTFTATATSFAAAPFLSKASLNLKNKGFYYFLDS